MNQSVGLPTPDPQTIRAAVQEMKRIFTNNNSPTSPMTLGILTYLETMPPEQVYPTLAGLATQISEQDLTAAAQEHLNNIPEGVLSMQEKEQMFSQAVAMHKFLTSQGQAPTWSPPQDSQMQP
jgi:hypothetical protein